MPKITVHGGVSDATAPAPAPETAADVLAAFEAGVKGVTAPPEPESALPAALLSSSGTDPLVPRQNPRRTKGK